MIPAELTSGNATGSEGKKGHAARALFFAGVVSAVPGVMLVAASLVLSLTPSNGDLNGYFVPLRSHTAAVFSGEHSPYWNPDVGCGEPYFANPQTGILYPPIWLAASLGPHQRIAFEVGFHLALLGVGCALLAGRIGARPWAAAAAGVGLSLSGPIADACGVLNNLDTLAWVPWMWWAALSRRPAALALAFVGAWLGAEPQLAVLAALISIVLVPKRRTLCGLGVGIGLAAVSILPFVVWVLGGDRGGAAVAGAPSGVLRFSDLAAVVIPCLELTPRPDIFLHHPYLPLWALVFAAVGAVAAPSGARVLARVGLILVVLAVVAGLPGGQKLWGAITGGLVRFPARLVMLAAVALLPAAAASLGIWRARRWAVAAVTVVGAAALALGPGHGLVAAGGVLAAGSAAAGLCPPAVALGGSVVLALPFLDVLGLAAPPPSPDPLACAELQRGQRVYTPAPSWDLFSWVREDPVARARVLGTGYRNLDFERQLVRSFAPLSSRVFTRHLAEADRGPEGRWWLDALAAARFVAHHPVAGFPLRCHERGVFVYDNPQAFPEVQLLASMPTPGVRPQPVGRIRAQQLGDDSARWSVDVPANGAVLVRAGTPDPGWRFSIDGVPARVVQGPGILHGVDVSPGRHEIRASYRPAGFGIGTALSVFGVILFVILGRAPGPVPPSCSEDDGC